MYLHTCDDSACQLCRSIAISFCSRYYVTPAYCPLIQRILNPKPSKTIQNLTTQCPIQIVLVQFTFFWSSQIISCSPLHVPIIVSLPKGTVKQLHVSFHNGLLSFLKQYCELNDVTPLYLLNVHFFDSQRRYS